MGKVAIVTDSTTYLQEEQLRGYPIYVVPLNLIFGSETLLDGIDITPKQFYERLKTSKINPSTSQPSPAAFIELFKKLLDEGYDILNMLISSKLSGTVDSAMQAKNEFPGAKIEVVDSYVTTMALGFQVISIAQAAKEGATLAECTSLAEKMRDDSGAFFTVPTLEFLRRGGRIGGAAAFLGTALDMKPVLELRNGHIEAIERVRSMNKAMDRMIDLFVKRINGHNPVRLAVLHAAAPEEAKVLMERIRNCCDFTTVRDAVFAEVSPVIGTHTGPGTLGIAFALGF
jgi:DegV family protein with EDD domain